MQCALAAEKLYRDPVTNKDISDATGLSLPDLCNTLPLASKNSFLGIYNDPMFVAHLFHKYLHWCPDIALTDPNPELVHRIKTYVKERISAGTGLTPQLVATLRSLLPAKYSFGFDRIPAGVQLPADHHVHPNAQSGWYFIVGNVFSKSGAKFGVEVIFWYSPLFPRNFLHAHGIPEGAFFTQSMSLAVVDSAGNRFAHNKVALLTGAMALTAHSDANATEVFFSVGRSFMQSEDASLSVLSINSQDVDAASGLAINVAFTLQSTKPLFMQGSGKSGCVPCIDGLGTLYYSYPRYTISDFSLAVDFPDGGPLRLATTDIDQTRSFFWLDHQWTYGFFGKSYVSSVITRAIGNIVKPVGFAGWFWFAGHLADGRDFTMTVAMADALLELPKGPMKFGGNATAGAKFIGADGVAGKQIKGCAVTVGDWFSWPIPGLSAMTAFLARSFTLTLSDEVFLLRVDYDAPVSVTRTGGIYREGPATIYSGDGQTMLGSAFVEMANIVVTEQDSRNIPLGILGGSLQLDGDAVRNLSSRPVPCGLVVKSVVLLVAIFLLTLLFLWIVYTTIKLLYYKLNDIGKHKTSP